jgi:hypothetical protein
VVKYGTTYDHIISWICMRDPQISLIQMWQNSSLKFLRNQLSFKHKKTNFTNEFQFDTFTNEEWILTHKTTKWPKNQPYISNAAHVPNSSVCTNYLHIAEANYSEWRLRKGAGTAQWYSAGLWAGWSGVWVPEGAGNFSLYHCVQTNSGAHPMGTSGSFAGGKVVSWPLTSI